MFVSLPLRPVAQPKIEPAGGRPKVANKQKDVHCYMRNTPHSNLAYVPWDIASDMHAVYDSAPRA